MDAAGNYTGEYTVGYTTPVKTLMNVSGGRGQADISLFGLTDTFSRTATTQDLETNWNTEMVFWIDNNPDTEPFDYRVVAVSRTINQVVIALAEVETDDTDIELFVPAGANSLTTSENKILWVNENNN